MNIYQHTRSWAKIVLVATLAIILVSATACSSQVGPNLQATVFAQQTQLVELGGPTEPPHPIATQVPEPTCLGWKYMPFKYGDYQPPEGGWRSIVIYFALQNCQNGPMFAKPDDYPLRLYELAGIKSLVPNIDLNASYITTNEGASYSPVDWSLMGHTVIAILPDDQEKYRTYLGVMDLGIEDFTSYAFEQLPPIPPGFKMFSTIAFEKVAANTTGWVWIDPNGEKHVLDKLPDVKLPYDTRPAFLKEANDILGIDKATIAIDAKRNASGELEVSVQTNNQGFNDLDLTKIGLWVFDAQGRPIGGLEANPFLCVDNGFVKFGLCEAPKTAGPGQNIGAVATYPIPDGASDLFVEVTYGNGLASDGSFGATYWTVIHVR